MSYEDYDEAVVPLYERVKLLLFDQYMMMHTAYRNYRNKKSPRNLKRLCTEIVDLYLLLKPKMNKNISKEHKKAIDQLEKLADDEFTDLNIKLLYESIVILDSMLELVGVTKISFNKIKPEMSYRY